jgi:hypothetical protein
VGGRGPPSPLNLEVMILSNERDLNETNELKPSGRHNLTNGEKQALKFLPNNEKLVFKPADIGSSVVILKTEDYLESGFAHLTYENSYKKLEYDSTEKYRREIQNEI